MRRAWKIQYGFLFLTLLLKEFWRIALIKRNWDFCSVMYCRRKSKSEPILPHRVVCDARRLIESACDKGRIASPGCVHVVRDRISPGFGCT